MDEEDFPVVRLSPEDAAELLDRVAAVDARIEALSDEERARRLAERRERGRRALAQMQRTPPKKLALT